MTWFSKKSKFSNSFTLEPAKFINEVHIDVSHYPDLHKQLLLLQLTKEDLAVLKQLQPEVEQLIPNMVEYISYFTGDSLEST